MSSDNFGQRLTPLKTFVSYTPRELQLQKLTLQNPAWIQYLSARYKEFKRHELETFFRHYINDYFPIDGADPEHFAEYIIQQDQKSNKPAPVLTEHFKLWHASDPRGQLFDKYPSIEDANEGSFSADIIRRR